VKALRHRVAAGRLHPVERGVYAVGRPVLGAHGKWMAAALSCGPAAVLSHDSAAALWGISEEASARISVTVPDWSGRRRPGLDLHRHPNLRPSDTTRRLDIPVTTVVRTLIDIACELEPRRLEAAVSEADRLGLIDPEALRNALPGHGTRRGVGVLREILDRRTFRLTDSELERRFLGLVAAAGLPMPMTQQRVNGFRVDFFWPGLGLVVETDGLTYHRTPAQQARDRLRDQAHTAAGLASLRFIHAQVRFEPDYVSSTLASVLRRLERAVKS
jgi:very-short-patch-repair endonuclease